MSDRAHSDTDHTECHKDPIADDEKPLNPKDHALKKREEGTYSTLTTDVGAKKENGHDTHEEGRKNGHPRKNEDGMDPEGGARFGTAGPFDPSCLDARKRPGLKHKTSIDTGTDGPRNDTNEFVTPHLAKGSNKVSDKVVLSKG